MSKIKANQGLDEIIWEWSSIEHYQKNSYADNLVTPSEAEITNNNEARTRLPKKVFTEGNTWHVEEKMDGSQLSFRLNPESKQIIFRTRNSFIHEVDPFGNKQLAAAILAITAPEIKVLLNPNFIYRGEAIVKPRHNRIKYARCPRHYFVLFDVENCETHKFLSYDEKVAEALRINFETAPLLFKSDKGAADEPHVWTLLDQLDKGQINSLLGSAPNNIVKPEGIVIKNYNYIKETSGVPGLLKLVREEFQEAVHKKIDEADKKEDITSVIGAQYAVEARYYKAVQRLRDRGDLKYEMKFDAPKIAHELDRDLFKECKDEIVHMLLAKFFPQIAIAAREDFNSWYKIKLGEFKEDDADFASTVKPQ